MSLKLEVFSRDRDLEGQRRLFVNAFPEQIGTSLEGQGHYFWKFASFPNLPNSYEYGAWDNNLMVGYYAAIPYSYSIEGVSACAGMVCDVMTHSEARGKGVFTRLGHFALQRMRENGIDFTIGYPIRPAVLPGHLKVGWRVAFKLPMYLKIIRTYSILNLYRVGWLSPLIDLIFYIYNALVVGGLVNWRIRSSPYEMRSLAVKDFLELSNYSEFFQAWSKTVKNYLIKNQNFYRWRLGAPSSEYQCHTVFRQGALVGVAITRKIDLRKVPSLAILDLMVLPEHQPAYGLLFEYLKGIATGSGAEVIVTMMSAKTASRCALIWNGFIRSPLVFKLIINSLSNKLDRDKLLDEKNWHLMWIDSDDI